MAVFSNSNQLLTISSPPPPPPPRQKRPVSFVRARATHIYGSEQEMTKLASAHGIPLLTCLKASLERQPS